MDKSTNPDIHARGGGRDGGGRVGVGAVLSMFYVLIILLPFQIYYELERFLLQNCQG